MGEFHADQRRLVQEVAFPALVTRRAPGALLTARRHRPGDYRN